MADLVRRLSMTAVLLLLLLPLYPEKAEGAGGLTAERQPGDIRVLLYMTTW